VIGARETHPADIAGDHQKTPVSKYAVFQVRKGLFVRFTQPQKRWIRADVKRHFFEAIVVKMHREFPDLFGSCLKNVSDIQFSDRSSVFQKPIVMVHKIIKRLSDIHIFKWEITFLIRDSYNITLKPCQSTITVFWLN